MGIMFKYYTLIKSKYPVLCTIIKRMFCCSMIAMILNPTSWLFLSSSIIIVTSLQLFGLFLCFVALYLVPYLVIGSAEWYWLRKKSWSVQTIVIWFSVNFFILSVILLFSYMSMAPSRSGPKCLSPLVLIIPVASLIGSLLSAIPISCYCKHYHHELTQSHLTDENKE